MLAVRRSVKKLVVLELGLTASSKHYLCHFSHLDFTPQIVAASSIRSLN